MLQLPHFKVTRRQTIMLSQRCYWAVLILLQLLFPNTFSASGTEIYEEALRRSKRQLLFPNSTLLQVSSRIIFVLIIFRLIPLR